MTRVIVTAIQERQPFVDYLQKHIPHLEIVWDQTRNYMDTFLSACLIAGDDPVIRLEDDVCLTKNFVEKIEKVITEHPNDVIQFFSRSKYDIETGSRYKNGGSFSMNQCTYYPAGFSHALYNYYPAWTRKLEHPTGTDLMMGDYMSQNRMNYWVHVPSLVNHAPVKSQIDSKRSTARQAKVFIDPELDGYPL